MSREIEFYNLDVIISVGYRVKSLRGYPLLDQSDQPVTAVHPRFLDTPPDICGDNYVVEFLELAHGHSEAELQTALVRQGGFKKS